MQPHRIDILARTLATSLSRRGVLAALGLASGAAELGPLAPARVGAVAAELPSARLQRDACQRVNIFSKKIVGGSVRVDDASCPDPCGCDDQKVYGTSQDFTGELAEYPCDETQGEIPDGSLLRFVTTRAFRVRGDGNLPGQHDGSFEITSPNGQTVVKGEIHGTDGLNTERGECEPGRVEGILRGTGTGPFEGCDVVVSYRGAVGGADTGDPCSLDWPSFELILGGVVVCPCDGTKQQTCIDFTGMTPNKGTGSLSLPPLSFDLPSGAWQVRSMTSGGPVGLDCGFQLVITMPASSEVDLTLVHYAQPAKMTAFQGGPNGSPVASDVMTSTQKTPQSFTLSGGTIDTVVIEPPSDETLLLKVCWVPI